jgi:DNA modification methylase
MKKLNQDSLKENTGSFYINEAQARAEVNPQFSIGSNQKIAKKYEFPAKTNNKHWTLRLEILKNDAKELFYFLKNSSDGAIISTLEKFGKLKNSCVKEPLLYLMGNKNNKIRTLAIKNLAKLNENSLVNQFVDYALKDSSTDVKREAVSAIGRLRDEKNISILRNFLLDKDPKIVMQAIRGLLVFFKNSEVKSALKKLVEHPNEVISEVIKKEFNKTSSQPAHSHRNNEALFLKNLIVHGDVSQILKYVPNQSIHLTFTSPPYYNARDYSIYQSYEEYLNFLEVVFKEVHRITKEGRFFILNTSPIIIPRISRAHSSKRYPIPYDVHHRLTKMGWEFIDDIIWVKPEASVKNRNAGFLQHRKPLAYKPNAITENLMVYRKKTDKLIDWNIKQYNSTEVEKSKVKEKYETTNVWRIDPTFDKVHSAVFPLELCNRVIKYYSFIGDLVFDPFAGSGTLGKSALKLERNFFLTESNKEYIERMKQVLIENPDLFHYCKAGIRCTNLEEFIIANNNNIKL